MKQTLLKTQIISSSNVPAVPLLSWKQAPPGRALYMIRISEFESRFDDLKAYLNKQELLKSENYLFLKDRVRYVLAKSLLKLLLGKALNKHPLDLRFYFEKNLKPRVEHHGEALHYNVSHSGDIILIALGDQAVGVDIEFKDPTFKFEHILELSFAYDELDFIQQSPVRTDAFYLLWTRKEALLKATGKGIDNDLPLIPVLNGVHSASCEKTGSDLHWTIASFEPAKHYQASLAFPSGIESPKLEIFKLDTAFLDV